MSSDDLQAVENERIKIWGLAAQRDEDFRVSGYADLPVFALATRLLRVTSMGVCLP
jgi:hypothetical protein